MLKTTRVARQYRRDLETLLLAVKGEVNPLDAHHIDEAAGAEIHASICRWLLRERVEKMTPSDIINCSREILRAKGIRNRAVQRLGLGPQAPDPNTIDALYANTTPRIAADAPDLPVPGNPPAEADCRTCGGVGVEEHLPDQWRKCPDCGSEE